MKTVVPLLALFASLPALAQVPDSVHHTLGRIFASADFAPQRFGPARWIENGAAYTTLEKSASVADASDIVRYETATGNRSVYVSARQLVPSGASLAEGRAQHMPARAARGGGTRRDSVVHDSSVRSTARRGGHETPMPRPPRAWRSKASPLSRGRPTARCTALAGSPRACNPGAR